MGGVQRFEDLVAWQVAREVTKEIYTLTRSGPFAKDFGLIDQMRRAAVSIMSNIAEGFERESLPEGLHFYAVAKASCAELRSQLYVALDAEYLKQEQFDALQAKSHRLARLLSGLRTAIAKAIPSKNGST
jgi:four helix bundle protein